MNHELKGSITPELQEYIDLIEHVRSKIISSVGIPKNLLGHEMANNQEGLARFEKYIKDRLGK